MNINCSVFSWTVLSDTCTGGSTVTLYTGYRSWEEYIKQQPIKWMKRDECMNERNQIYMHIMFMLILCVNAAKHVKRKNTDSQ